MLLPSLVQVSESISGSVVPLAMFFFLFFWPSQPGGNPLELLAFVMAHILSGVVRFYHPRRVQAARSGQEAAGFTLSPSSGKNAVTVRRFFWTRATPATNSVTHRIVNERSNKNIASCENHFGNPKVLILGNPEVWQQVNFLSAGLQACRINWRLTLNNPLNLRNFFTKLFCIPQSKWWDRS